MVDKEVLTDKQNESGYFMYFALNVRAPRDTTWLDSQVSVKIYCFIGLKKLHYKSAGRVDQLNRRFPKP